MSSAWSKESLPDPLSSLRRVSVTRRVGTCDPGQEPGREERETPSASVVGDSARTREEDDAPAVSPSALGGKIASFGPFRLHVTERLLEKNGTTLKIGSRALDILLMLLEHAPEVVGKRRLIRRVWGNWSSMRSVCAFTLPPFASDSATRTNIPGRGYCFTGAVSWAETQATPRKARTAASQLPREPLLMVGRDITVRDAGLTSRGARHI